MIVGVDFDNTIVCYDGAFHRAACERGLIPFEVPPLKEAVRDYLRGIGREDDWTELQGYVYGTRMDAASPFEGAAACLRYLTERGAEVHIISHKTLHPYRGVRYNLHDAARGWLEGSGFLELAGLGMQQVFFELTKEEKLARIGRMACTHFIDDLPEILLAERFPAGTARLLFAPQLRESRDGIFSFGSWEEITDYFRGSDAR